MKKLTKLKKVFIFGLIASLIISALVAVVTVIIGEFHEVTSKVLWTLSMVVVHSLISLLFIWRDEKTDSIKKLSMFMDILFVLIVISFLTSIFGIWKIIPGATISDLYLSYFVIAFSSLHINILSIALSKKKYIDNIVYTNYGFVVVVGLMTLPLIFIKNAFEVLGDMYSRIISAMGIINWTLSVLIIIFYKMHLHKHPEAVILTETKTKKKISPWVWVLLIFLLIIIVVPIVLTFTLLSYL